MSDVAQEVVEPSRIMIVDEGWFLAAKDSATPEVAAMLESAMVNAVSFPAIFTVIESVE